MQSQGIGYRLSERPFTRKALGSGRRSLPKPARKGLAVTPRGVAEFVKDIAKGPSSTNGSKPLRLEEDDRGIEYDIVRKANFVVGSDDLVPGAAYRATALSVREHLIDAFNKTQKSWR